jgi:hypothetical protein
MGAKRLTDTAWEALLEGLASFWWRKQTFQDWLHRRLRDYPELLARLDFTTTKRMTAGQLVRLLSSDEDRYQGFALDLLAALAEVDPAFRHLQREENADQLIRDARAALEEVRRVTAAYSEETRARQRVQADIEAEAARNASRRDHDSVLRSLAERFMSMHTSARSPQNRGRDFEGLLRDLLNLYDLEPKAAYSLPAEQIDGAFTFGTDDYLLEAKWVRDPIEPKHLRDFDGKIASKAKNTLGLFISVSGFTSGAQEFRGQNGTAIVLMDGTDLLAVLEQRIEFPELLERKRRHAVETGSPWLPLHAVIGT